MGVIPLGIVDLNQGVRMSVVGMLSSPAEWIVVLIIVVIFFGVGKLPKVMGQMGKGVKAFKEGMKETDSEKAQKAIDVTPNEPLSASLEAEPAEIIASESDS